MKKKIILCMFISFTCLVANLATVFARQEIEKAEIPLVEKSLRKRIKHSVKPTYPNEAINMGEKGQVVAEIIVNGEGKVVACEITKSSHQSLSDAVKAAVNQWEFNPYVESGKAQVVQGKLTFEFLLNGKNGKVKEPK